jgi:uncharacterized protein YukE
VGVVGADADQLRSTAAQLARAADRLQGTLQHLTGSVTNAMSWRGPDAERFRSEWNGQSVHAIRFAIDSLRSGADTMRRNADEQVDASRASGGGGTGAGRSANDPEIQEQAPSGLQGLWKEIGEIPKESSGYRVQKVIGADGVERYVIYIAGTSASATQTPLSNVPAISGQLDREQVAALTRLIPKDAEVMIVGYSQGGIDAQNIASSNLLNVQQIVTYGSPVRNDLNTPSIHLQYSQDLVPYSAAMNPGLYNSAASAGNSNVEVFQANPLPTSPFGLGEHMGGYGELAGKWDDEVSAGQGGRAASSADGLTKFHGDVVGQLDVGSDGTAEWKPESSGGGGGGGGW